MWDLSAGDIFPAETDQVQGRVTAIDLSCGVDNDKHVTHLVSIAGRERFTPRPFKLCICFIMPKGSCYALLCP